jgi:hypothetical protein
MTPHDRFTHLIQDLFKESEESPSVSGDGYLLQFDGRMVHLGLDADRSEVTISTQVYFVDEDADELTVDLITEFNAHHLFNGGYRMGRDPESYNLYVSQCNSVAHLERAGLHVYLDDFISRCVACTRWCGAEAVQRPPSEAAMAYLQPLIDGTWSAPEGLLS